MTLQEATFAFIDRIKGDYPPTEQHPRPQLSVEAFELFEDYSRASGLKRIDQITASALRDFLARWYVERASGSPANEKIPSPEALLGSLEEFLKWANEKSGEIVIEDCMAVLSELEESLPRAIQITRALAKHLNERGGAFGFPEFLTSFEQGGHSEYDIGEPGEVSAIEGYFLIERVEQTRIEAVDMVSDKRIWPVIFPEEVARLITAGFIINLEIIRAGETWQITGCGFALPPNTEI
jgi:hypothetical protein